MALVHTGNGEMGAWMEQASNVSAACPAPALGGPRQRPAVHAENGETSAWMEQADASAASPAPAQAGRPHKATVHTGK
eukprot:1161695-Pelagomonas_calceolata.AAC.6